MSMCMCRVVCCACVLKWLCVRVESVCGVCVESVCVVYVLRVCVDVRFVFRCCGVLCCVVMFGVGAGVGVQCVVCGVCGVWCVWW